MTKCTHTPGEMDTAAHFDRLCPICLKEELDAARKELAIASVKLERANGTLRIQKEILNKYHKRYGTLLP